MAHDALTQAVSQAELNTLKAFREEKTALERDLDDVRRAADQREAQLLRQADQVERDHRAEIVKVTTTRALDATGRSSADPRLERAADSSGVRVGDQCGTQRVAAPGRERPHPGIETSARRQRPVPERTVLPRAANRASGQGERSVAREGQGRSACCTGAPIPPHPLADHAWCAQEQARQLELAAGKERHYAERGAQQQRRIRELLRKVDSVEHDLVQATQAGQASVVEVEQAASAELAACRIETAECRAALDVKARELQHMRVLARVGFPSRSR